MGSGMEILVGGEYKPGRVTTTVTDLVVPAPGLPIQIQRSYDSLVRGVSSDFGFGWSLGIKVQLDVSPSHDVTLTLNGQRKTFFFTPYVPGFQLSSSMFIPNILGVYFAGYTGEPGMFGTLAVTNTGCVLDWLVRSEQMYFCYANAGTYLPELYIYTDPYGRVYTIGGDGSLQSIKDLAGNTLTVTPNGITASNGLSVPFLRDLQERITQITDTLGNVYKYGYDGAGNLANVTYPTTPATTASFTYDLTHLYLSGTDWRGNPLPTTTYDTSGRLQSVTLHPCAALPCSSDPVTSYTTSYAYSLATNTTTITYPPDDNGQVGTATMVYDAYGKLLSSKDPLGLTTTNVYDLNHNLVSVTDPLGHTTSYTYDGNGNRNSITHSPTPGSVNTTISVAYNSSGQPTQITNELGNIVTITYDANHWPKSASDAIGPLGSFTFNANGTQKAKAVGYDLTSTPGKATTYTYDLYGNLASQTDALGRQTTYIYDQLGRQTSMTPRVRDIEVEIRRAGAPPNSSQTDR
jgi:YD repeat-containing protein